MLALPPAQLATTILTLAAAGQPVPEVLLAMLADAVLAAPLPCLALAVRAGGEHRLGRAIELAEIVIKAEQPQSDGLAAGVTALRA